MFFIKPSKVVIDFFTTYPIVLDVNAPKRATKAIPSWWSNLPNSIHQHGALTPMMTAKNCPAIIDYFSNSVCVPMWCDFIVEVGPVGSGYFKYQYADLKSSIEVHDTNRRGAFLPNEHYQQLELQSPWFAKTKQNVNWVVTHPTWCFELHTPVIHPPAILNFHHQRKTHKNMFVPRFTDETYQLEIHAGQPLYFMTPMTDKRIDIRLHRISESEVARLDRPSLFFVRDALRARKCPVHK